MSPRNQRPRKVSNPPLISGMKPYGKKLPSGNRSTIFIQFEEYESLRLCDYEGLNHQNAAWKMDVSRPTLTRIYTRARKKVAVAMVEGKKLIIEGGKIYFDSDWYTCFDCGCYFNHPEKQFEAENCTLCGSKKIELCKTDPEELNE